MESMMAENQLIYHGLVSRFSTLAIDLEIMRASGFDGLEISAAKMRNVLEAGFHEQELAQLLAKINIPGIGFLLDIERRGDDKHSLICEAQALFHLARIAGARGVQVLTGPVDVRAIEAIASLTPSELYEGVARLPRSEQIAVTAGNLALLADEAAKHGLLIYLESLAWTPLNRLTDQIELIARASRDNVRLVVDYWHCYASGDQPEDVARLDGEMIYGVHICDSLAFAGGIPNETVLRDVPTGKGALDLREWTDAVKSTGYKGWWSCELFCRRQQQDNSFVVAKDLHSLMYDLIFS
jgi:sugar phosphate isomerase/epimerase